MTRNETQRKYITEAVDQCKESQLPTRMWGDYGTAYLAGKLADRDEHQTPPLNPRDTALQKWMWENPKYVYGVLSDIDSDELADLIVRGPQAIGIYVLGKLRESMIDDLESQDPEPDREAEHDYKQRVRDAKDEEEEWLGVC